MQTWEPVFDVLHVLSGLCTVVGVMMCWWRRQAGTVACCLRELHTGSVRADAPTNLPVPLPPIPFNPMLCCVWRCRFGGKDGVSLPMRHVGVGGVPDTGCYNDESLACTVVSYSATSIVCTVPPRVGVDFELYIRR